MADRALKVIKPGMDSKEVIARFEAERQALALMDHPNVARVIDAGTSTGGGPYFVMELVRGFPITEYCDEVCLDTRQWLEMFVKVCQAVLRTEMEVGQVAALAEEETQLGNRRPGRLSSRMSRPDLSQTESSHRGFESQDRVVVDLVPPLSRPA